MKTTCSSLNQKAWENTLICFQFLWWLLNWYIICWHVNNSIWYPCCTPPLDMILWWVAMFFQISLYSIVLWDLMLWDVFSWPEQFVLWMKLLSIDQPILYQSLLSSNIHLESVSMSILANYQSFIFWHKTLDCVIPCKQN